jgi:hypothetical protein
LTSTTAAGLDVHAAIARHQRLRQRLLACSNGYCDPQLNAEDLCFDHHCLLGQWLHGPAKARLGQHRGFLDLLEQHRMFHVSASNVVALSRAGHQDRAQRMAQQQMEAFSNGVLKRLQAMQAWVDRRTQRRQAAAGQTRLNGRKG